MCTQWTLFQQQPIKLSSFLNFRGNINRPILQSLLNCIVNLLQHVLIKVCSTITFCQVLLKFLSSVEKVWTIYCMYITCCFQHFPTLYIVITFTCIHMQSYFHSNTFEWIYFLTTRSLILYCVWQFSTIILHCSYYCTVHVYVHSVYKL